jgi:hypothetical protein
VFDLDYSLQIFRYLLLRLLKSDSPCDLAVYSASCAADESTSLSRFLFRSCSSKNPRTDRLQVFSPRLPCLADDIVFVCAMGRAIGGARSCAVKFRKHARIDVLATHVHLILSTQPGYLNTYYVNMSAQVNYQRIVRSIVVRKTDEPD